MLKEGKESRRRLVATSETAGVPGVKTLRLPRHDGGGTFLIGAAAPPPRHLGNLCVLLGPSSAARHLRGPLMDADGGSV